MSQFTGKVTPLPIIPKDIQNAIADESVLDAEATTEWLMALGYDRNDIYPFGTFPVEHENAFPGSLEYTQDQNNIDAFNDYLKARWEELYGEDLT